MNKKLLLFIMLLLTCFGMAKAEIVEVGSNSATTTALPTNVGYLYSISQQIYEASEIGRGGSIISISFLNTSTVQFTRKMKISLAHTDKSNFFSYQEWIDVPESSVVFDDPVTFKAQDWTKIEFDTPFEYDGTSNIVLTIYDYTGVSSNSEVAFGAYSASKQAHYVSDNHVANLDPSHGAMSGNKNMIKLTFDDAGGSSFGGSEVVQIGTGDKSTQDVPICYYAKYSKTQQIYEASEIGRSGYITSVSFFNKSDNECTRELEFYLTPTVKTTFSSANDWESEDYPSVWVFGDEVTFKAQDWTRIEFVIPFYYDGTSNLILSCIDKTGLISTGPIWFASDIASNKAIYAQSSQFNFSNGRFSSHRNTIKLEFLDWQVGSGEGTSDYLPTNTYYNYSLSQQIYTTDELGIPEDDKWITSVSFFNTGDTRTRNLDIYMVPTDKTSFSGNSDWIPYTNNNKVFSGEVTFKQGEWTAIGFNVNDYDYTGRKNIAVIVDDNTGSYQYKVPFLAFEASNQAIYAYDDNINFNADGLSEYAGTVTNKKNQIRFNDAELDQRAYDLTVSNLTYNSAKISWKSLGGCWNLDYRVAGTDTWYHALDPDYGLFLWDMYYKLIGLDQGTTYEVRVRSVLDEESDIFSDYVYTQFTTPERFPTPTDLEVMYVTPYSAMLRWTENGDATKWLLSSYPLTYEADRNPFIINGLTPGTSYRFAVRSVIVDEEEDEYYSNWSEEVSFTTPAVNPMPEISSVAPTPNSVTITWEGESEKYLVRCRKVGEEGEKLFFDDFEKGISLKWQVYTEGDPISISPNSGWLIERLGDNYAAASYSYEWWDGSPRGISADNWLLPRNPVELGGTLRFKVWGISEDKYEVLLSTTGNAVEDFTTTLRPLQVAPEDWTEVEIDLSEYEGQQGYIAIRHKDTDKNLVAIDDYGIYSSAWQTIETTENSATIEGLEPSTEYEFEVIGIMNHQPDASSSVYTFMTLDTNPKPFDVVITPTATTAHVSWTGFGTSYHVGYREVHEGGERVVFYDDFENGLEDKGWTIYTYGDKLPSQEEGWYVATASSLGVGSTSHVACSNSYYYDDGEISLNADNWLITPQVELGGTLRFKEWIRGDYPDSYEVRLSTTGKAKENFTIVLRPLSTGANGWTDVELDLSDYEGQMGYIAIHHYCTYQFWLCIDNFGIYHNADEYGPLINTDVTETECTLEGLTPNTTYECWIVSDLDGNRVWTITNFTTLNEPYDIVLDDNDDNIYILNEKDGVYANVTIRNRTFRKDGIWQGICLPFDVDVENSILAGADVRTLESEKQYLNAVIMNCLTPVTKMKAGTPYIIKWDSGSDIVNPVFESVVIDLEDRDVTLGATYYGLGAYNRNGGVSSSLVYSPFECTINEEYIFLMNGTSMLTPITADAGLTIHAFDIMFSVQDLYTDGTIVLLNTGEPDELIDGITSIEGNEEETIYNVAGQRLAKKQRGINIVNGRKILIK